MTVSIDIKTNAKELEKKLGMFQKKHLPEIIVDSVNETGVKATNAMRTQIAKNLDRPLRSTIKSVLFFPANLKKKELNGLIFIKNTWGKAANKGKTPAEFLKPLLEGGRKTPERQYVMTPTKNTKLNKFGNITKANRTKYFTDKAKYFVGEPKGFPSAGFGVWERYGRQAKGESSGYRIRKVANLVKSQQFSKQLDFFKTVGGTVKNTINKSLDKNMKRILRRV
jgi:hypothetical protein